METIELIRSIHANMHRNVDMTMKDMTDELFNWAAPGTANTISATFLHFVNVEDNFIHKLIQGKASVWESGNWSQKTGVDKPPSIGEDWTAFKRRKTAIQPVMDYKAAVWADTEVYLSGVSEVELDRLVKFAGGDRSVAEMLVLAATQSHSHAGEIAALKGVQGVKGLPV